MKIKKVFLLAVVAFAVIFGASCKPSAPGTGGRNEDEYPPYLDESITGTLYTVIPDSDTITVSLTLKEENGYIYEKSTSCKTSQSAGCISWTMDSALFRPSYHYYIVGDRSGHIFESSCGYKAENLTCKEFIDGQYDYLNDYYGLTGGIELDSLYSRLNKVLYSKSAMEYDELFF